jgi:general stress protein YciG
MRKKCNIPFSQSQACLVGGEMGLSGDEKKSKGKMSVAEAGRKGGRATAETHGKEFYSTIGKKGGEIGGEKTASTRGRGFYSEIGHKGGQKVKGLIEKGKERKKQ